MQIQKTNWGKIEWMSTTDNPLSGDRMNVGMVTMSVGAHMPPHVHCTEQVLYIVKGQGLSSSNGISQSVTAGELLHMDEGQTHEMWQIGCDELVHLLVSNPKNFELDSVLQRKKSVTFLSPVKEDDLHRIFLQSLESVCTMCFQHFPISFAIFDWHGILIKKDIFRAEHHAEQCLENLKLNKLCPCHFIGNPDDIPKQHTFLCPHGCKVISVPIFYEQYCLGCIQGGYIRQQVERQLPLEDNSDDFYDTPMSTEIGIVNLLRGVAHAVGNYCYSYFYELEFQKKDELLQENEHSQALLAENLRSTQHSMMNLQINNHFLFNILNMMSLMSLESENMELYRSIIDLSKMLRYTLRTKSEMVLLKNELDYLIAYTKLQGIRYKSDLKVIYQIDEAAYPYMVPFNFLQPVAENAFIHGFLPNQPKVLEISAEKSDILFFKIRNNGRILSINECERINSQMKSGSSHGLSMIYRKLFNIYGSKFDFSIHSSAAEQTYFTLSIPIVEEHGRISDD
ncbi:MAG: histidine kinase [Oscillospiraceae bacterium]